jgi:hypothetical protein
MDNLEKLWWQDIKDQQEDNGFVIWGQKTLSSNISNINRLNLAFRIPEGFEPWHAVGGYNRGLPDD